MNSSSKNSSSHLAGTVPWLPWPLSRWRWLTTPVRAERLATLRIGVAVVLLIDLCVGYLPDFALLYGPTSYSAYATGAEYLGGPLANPLRWSLLRLLPEQSGPWVALAVWIAAAVFLLLGWQAQPAAACAWALSVSFAHSFEGIHNSGHVLRSTLLLLLALTPCGAVWSVRAWLRPPDATVWVSPWAIRLLFIQLVVMYYWNGFYKLLGPVWRDGTVLHYALNDYTWSTLSPGHLRVPFWLLQPLTWLTVAWELGFPLLVLHPKVRTLALLTGALFHFLSFLFLDIGAFPLYALCFYLPLLPWGNSRHNADDTVG